MIKKTVFVIVILSSLVLGGCGRNNDDTYAQINKDLDKSFESLNVIGDGIERMKRERDTYIQALQTIQAAPEGTDTKVIAETALKKGPDEWCGYEGRKC